MKNSIIERVPSVMADKNIKAFEEGLNLFEDDK